MINRLYFSQLTKIAVYYRETKQERKVVNIKHEQEVLHCLSLVHIVHLNTDAKHLSNTIVELGSFRHRLLSMILPSVL